LEQLMVTTGTGYTAAAAGDNVLISNTTIAITGKATNTLHINNTSGVAITITNSGSALNPQNGLLFTGGSPIILTGGSIIGSTVDNLFLSTNTAGVTFSTPFSDASFGGTKSTTFGGPGNFSVTVSGSAASTGAF